MIEDKTEKLVLEKLITNENYARTVLPFLKIDYFNVDTGIIFETIYNFYDKYNSKPTKKTLGVELSKKKFSNDQKENLSSIYAEIDGNEDSTNQDNHEWLKDTTEKWCQEKALTNAIFDSIDIIEGKSKDLKKDAIPSIVQDALAVSFNRDIGHDYIDDFEKRYEFYHSDIERIPFDIPLLNSITRGGLPRGTLSAVAAGTGVGKSIFLCHSAASYITSGQNVLFISLEMSEESIGERVDANLLDIPVNDLPSVPKDKFTSKINDLKRKTLGKLIIKQYPTSSAHVGHFRALCDELKMKKNFVPDVIIVDYLNICASSRVRYSSGANSYTVVKAIAEELRSLAIEYNVPVLTATQLNRGGNEQDAEVDITNTSECIDVDAEIELRDGTKKKIGDVNVGDQITSNDGYKTVMLVHHKNTKTGYKIRTKSGKEIVVSEDHAFPTERGRISIKDGLQVGDKLNVK